MIEDKCKHGDVKFLGTEKCSSGGMNKYFQCLKCKCVLILSEDGTLYEIPGVNVSEK
jgi:hypothetical protein